MRCIGSERGVAKDEHLFAQCRADPLQPSTARSPSSHPDVQPYAVVQGQIFELKDGAGTIAPIVLKAAKKAALISDLEREWGVGQKVATLADDNGNLPGFMKVGPALRRPDGKIVGDRLAWKPHRNPALTLSPNTDPSEDLTTAAPGSNQGIILSYPRMLLL